MSGGFPTPVYCHAGRGSFQDVYQPAEDSFLLMEALEKDAETLQQMSPCVCVEVGSGSGAVSAFLASVIEAAGASSSSTTTTTTTGGGAAAALYICTDVNPAAARCTAQTARRNGVALQPVITDLVQSLLPRLCGQADVILFNPPYVVTPSEEAGGRGTEAAWAGGERGREVTDRFLPAVPRLLSSRGVFYLVTVAENKPEEITGLMRRWGLEGETSVSTRAGNERLSVLRFRRDRRAAAAAAEEEEASLPP